jgi:peptide methionine sulfoxide reductase msrA/msrB
MDSDINKGNNSIVADEIFFAGSCFQGTEHLFKLIKGVISTEVGYANAKTTNPKYREVKMDETSFPESVKVTYDPNRIDLGLLINLFLATIDPTRVNRQGNDNGTQYRSEIFYMSAYQLAFIREALMAIANRYDRPITVEVTPLQNFCHAEKHHENYLDKNRAGYCHIRPKFFEVARQAN